MPDLPHDSGFVEIADRCWLARHAWFDVNVTVVGGERGLLVVDTHASERAARVVLDQVRALGAGDVVAVVNTHEHFDHVLGNAVFADAYDGLHLLAHDTAAARMPEAFERVRRLYDDEPDDPHRREVQESRLVVPERTFTTTCSLDLGDREVELSHPGRGHTGGDAVVRVPAVDVLLAGDLVEESAARNGVPGFGDDCYPLEWAATLDGLVSTLGEASVVVPGHGLPVGRSFVEQQRDRIGLVAETIRDLAAHGVPVDEALAAAEWPYPREELAEAVRRGYEQLGAGSPAS